MSNNITNPTVIQMKAYDTTVTYELEGSDRTLDEVLHGFITCCIGLTWTKEQIISSMKEYLDENDEVY